MAMSPRPSGGRRRGTDYRPNAEINVTPLVDVMLVLLIVFMVAAPLMVTGVHVDLPRTSAAKIGQVRKPVIVTMARDGSLNIRDQATAADDLIASLQALRETEGDGVVYVRADRTIAYGDVIAMLGRVSAAGYSHVSLLAQAPAPALGVP